MSNLAIIPARGGSKRIPRKNIKNFLGKPIISYSIRSAIDSNLFDEIMVSTDDSEIAEVAQKYGAKVPFMRSEENSSDYSTTMDVLKEVLDNYELIGKKFDHACCIYPTAPLIKKGDLIKGYETLQKGIFDSVFPIVSFSYPVWRSVKIIGGKTKMIWPEYSNSRSQDLDSVYHDAGQWYWFIVKKFSHTLFMENTTSIILSELSVQDIDNETDWKLAELKYKLNNDK
ncbi:pseudaminic acid cytidylyltransferase [Apibacter sp. HY039]|uniref:pseudaminic acid cytidylyltransferase n=1 Tax=Apibacter sp. HY039 TaxID=2501476 RepID=UPI000FEB6565|nr:pseudaminic acid cytidylyltransferase [Apibacter sp. HY039]